MDWRARYADKLASAEDAAKVVNSGNMVALGMFGSNPEGLATALFARHTELRDVTILHFVAPFVWATPETADAFKLVTGFTTPADRTQVQMGMADYIPVGCFRESAIKAIYVTSRRRSSARWTSG